MTPPVVDRTTRLFHVWVHVPSFEGFRDVDIRVLRDVSPYQYDFDRLIYPPLDADTDPHARFHAEDALQTECWLEHEVAALQSWLEQDAILDGTLHVRQVPLPRPFHSFPARLSMMDRNAQQDARFVNFRWFDCPVVCWGFWNARGSEPEPTADASQESDM